MATILDITLNRTTFKVDYSEGGLVSPVFVVMDSGGYQGTVARSGPDAQYFTVIDGHGRHEADLTLIANPNSVARDYNISLTAGKGNSSKTVDFVITGV